METSQPTTEGMAEALQSGLLSPKLLGANIKTLSIRFRAVCCLTW